MYIAISVFLFALACNLDTVILAMGFTLKGTHITPTAAFLLAAVTTAVTALSIALGRFAQQLFSPDSIHVLGGVVLVAIGGWFILDHLRHPHQSEEGGPKTATLWSFVPLSAALAVNNAGAGIAAGMMGLPLLASVGCNFLVTLLALPFGRMLARGVIGRLLGRFALPLSGVLLIVVGILTAFVS